MPYNCKVKKSLPFVMLEQGHPQEHQLDSLQAAECLPYHIQQAYPVQRLAFDNTSFPLRLTRQQEQLHSEEKNKQIAGTP